MKTANYHLHVLITWKEYLWKRLRVIAISYVVAGSVNFLVFSVDFDCFWWTETTLTKLNNRNKAKVFGFRYFPHNAHTTSNFDTENVNILPCELSANVIWRNKTFIHGFSNQCHNSHVTKIAWFSWQKNSSKLCKLVKYLSCILQSSKVQASRTRKRFSHWDTYTCESQVYALQRQI